MGNSFTGETRRFMKGEAVWVSPFVSGRWLTDDEAVVLEDLGAGYIVLQESERVPSHGLGHFVCDLELSKLNESGHSAVREAKVRKLRDFSDITLSVLRRVTCKGKRPRQVAGRHSIYS
jgi:hypothetical protein